MKYKLVATAGRKKIVGKPMLYKTTREFLMQFGLDNLSELPSLKELEELSRAALGEEDNDGQETLFDDQPDSPQEDAQTGAEQDGGPEADVEQRGEPEANVEQDGPEAGVGQDADPGSEPVEAEPQAQAAEPPSPTPDDGDGQRSERTREAFQRLQKLIAHAGIASRRRAEEMIERGQVTVNGEIAKLGDKADLTTDAVKVDGRRLGAKPSNPAYIALNKPKACISTTSDPEGRRTVMHLLPPRFRNRVYPVGRLDYHSEGLMLLTNDGEFANGVLSTKGSIPKTYQVKVKGVLSKDQLEKFRAGIRIEGKITARSDQARPPRRQSLV